jgi:hypothetical protein
LFLHTKQRTQDVPDSECSICLGSSDATAAAAAAEDTDNMMVVMIMMFVNLESKPIPVLPGGNESVFIVF